MDGMISPPMFAWLADAVLALHVSLVLFVISGLVFALLGGARRWDWTRRFWLRLLHLAAIAIVVLESWFGIVCPLTTLEQWLRAQAGQVAYAGDFIGHWLGRLLFFDAPPWVFVLAYSAFGALVLLSWWLYPPQRASRREA